MSIYLGMHIDGDTFVRTVSGQLDGAILVFRVSPLLRADSKISIRAIAGFFIYRIHSRLVSYIRG